MDRDWYDSAVSCFLAVLVPSRVGPGVGMVPLFLGNKCLVESSGGQT